MHASISTCGRKLLKRPALFDVLQDGPMKEYKVLVINVGSTSTKVGLFLGERPAFQKVIEYSAEDLSSYPDLQSQLARRQKDLEKVLETGKVDPGRLDLIISRGGLGKPGPAGVYEINEKMCEDLMAGRYGKHPSALGPAMALRLAASAGIRSIIIDPPSTDEFHALARVTGLPDIARKSAFHALNQKAAARRAAAGLARKLEEINLIVAHLGGGITIGAHEKGRVVDCSHGLSEGPMTPERAGSLPTLDVLELALSGKDRKTLEKRLVGQGGLFAYLGTTDFRKIEALVKEGHVQADFLLHAMSYQIGKGIGMMSAVLKGKVDAVVLTGGLAHSLMLTDRIREWIGFLAPVLIFPGEDEMAAMAEGASRFLNGGEPLKKYGE